MASEKQTITILITGEGAARAIAKANILNFARDYCTRNQKPIPDYLEENPLWVLSSGRILEDFPFGDYFVNVMEFESYAAFNVNGAQCDICVNVIESPQPAAAGSIHFDRRYNFYGQDIAKEKLASQEALLFAARGTKPTISVQPAHQKSWKSSVFFFLMLAIGLLTFTALASAGLLFTPFLAIPIAFLALTVIAVIKVAYDDRSPQPSSVNAEQIPTSITAGGMTGKPRSNNLSQDALRYVQKSSPLVPQTEASKTQPSEKAENLDVGKLLVRGDDELNYLPLENCVDTDRDTNRLIENQMWAVLFKERVRFGNLANTCFSDAEIVLELSFYFRVNDRESEGFRILICTENAPFIKEMINKNYCNAFMTDGEDTELKTKIMSALNGPLKSISPERVGDLGGPKYN